MMNVDNRNNNTSINDDEISFDNVEIEVSINFFIVHLIMKEKLR